MSALLSNSSLFLDKLIKEINVIYKLFFKQQYYYYYKIIIVCKNVEDTKMFKI